MSISPVTRLADWYFALPTHAHTGIYHSIILLHKYGAAEGGEVARNQAPPHRLDWPINAMFILGIRKSKIKQNGYYLFFHFLLLNISHNAGKTLLLTHF